MKKSLLLLAVLIANYACKQKQENTVTPPTLTVAEKIANANGFEHWKDVSQIKFTFNVDKDTTHFERSWSWKPKTNAVVLITGKDTIAFNRSAVDSTSVEADRNFINDKFWLLVPFQLVWDSGTTITEPVVIDAPISKAPLNKITLTYTNEGGYTPGDAYDIYFSDDFIIKEWVFRKSNATKPTMMTTWENYKDFNGLKIALDHKKPEENWNLNFTNIAVEMH